MATSVRFNTRPAGTMEGLLRDDHKKTAWMFRKTCDRLNALRQTACHDVLPVVLECLHDPSFYSDPQVLIDPDWASSTLGSLLADESWYFNVLLLCCAKGSLDPSEEAEIMKQASATDPISKIQHEYTVELVKVHRVNVARLEQNKKEIPILNRKKKKRRTVNLGITSAAIKTWKGRLAPETRTSLFQYCRSKHLKLFQAIARNMQRAVLEQAIDKVEGYTKKTITVLIDHVCPGLVQSDRDRMVHAAYAHVVFGKALAGRIQELANEHQIIRDKLEEWHDLASRLEMLHHHSGDTGGSLKQRLNESTHNLGLIVSLFHRYSKFIHSCGSDAVIRLVPSSAPTTTKATNTRDKWSFIPFEFTTIVQCILTQVENNEKRHHEVKGRVPKPLDATPRIDGTSRRSAKKARRSRKPEKKYTLGKLNVRETADTVVLDDVADYKPHHQLRTEAMSIRFKIPTGRLVKPNLSFDVKKRFLNRFLNLDRFGSLFNHPGLQDLILETDGYSANVVFGISK